MNESACGESPRRRRFSEEFKRDAVRLVAIALILRNQWVWLHHTHLAEGSGDNLTLHLERLRFKRMLDWIVHSVQNLYHDGSTPCVKWKP